MRKPITLGLAIVLLAATGAQAQYGGPGGGSGGRRHGGDRGAPSGSSSSSSPAAVRPGPRPVPVSDTDIIGVVKAIDLASKRITIAYEPVQARNWPAGTMPFVVDKPELLTGASVGEKVRFKVDSQQIVELAPY